MTVPVAMNDPATGRFAMYDEAPGGGDPADPNSLRNRPLNDPINWLSLIYFHADFDNMEVFYNNTSPITVAHSAVASSGAPTGANGSSGLIAFGLGTGFADRLLYTHGLGYVPFAIAYVGNNILWPGMPVQVDGSGGMRFVMLYATATEIRLYEYSSTGAGNLAAINIDYYIMVFKEPPAPVGNILLDFDPLTGVVEMSRGKFKSDRRYLQVVPGGSPLGISYGRTIDLKNGAIRAYRPDGTAFEPVPTGQAVSISRPFLDGGASGAVYGADITYNGAFAFTGAIQVQAP